MKITQTPSKLLQCCTTLLLKMFFLMSKLNFQSEPFPLLLCFMLLLCSLWWALTTHQFRYVELLREVILTLLLPNCWLLLSLPNHFSRKEALSRKTDGGAEEYFSLLCVTCHWAAFLHPWTAPHFPWTFSCNYHTCRILFCYPSCPALKKFLQQTSLQMIKLRVALLNGHG